MICFCEAVQKVDVCGPRYWDLSMFVLLISWAIGCGNNRSGERVNDDTVIITMMVIKSKLH